MTDRYVILDRDGTINVDSDTFIKSPDEWLPLPGSLEAIAELNRHGYKVVVISNQSGIARGLFDLAALEAMHDKLRRMLAEMGGRIEAIYFCPHGPEDHCTCRKPKPGLFEAFAQEKRIDLTNVYSVGDSYRDIEASLAAGAKPMLVKTGKGRQTIHNHPQLKLPIFDNLYDAATHIVSTS
ncbi:D-glycero-beta-D-manno-heptose 1,7-bisphosphate 7-phosphatase [Methylomonas sp. LL1]|uniref:D-glycero-beta-D-manno-heptose 1,7-bisphosphate 7-phosphatase n=1 Tax=Methylomonas sp. LL1 TaxID=2785785 RepID=UPI0018C363A2|nr:D-glycero-beta-D-manno-heptose 1,7-bisphosphate 7-phosphatase [Methylomonas sp. LL1]QPK62357.1 D-glycero-beta-D-manno-heptose 1,7-bisphosphate 7-phosphatase [Methylomonas sp. LL1]